MLRDAKQTALPNSIDVRWYFVALVTAAIAISYFDRQTLPVAISAIQRTIPLSNQQFSWLQFAFLIPYAVLYAAGGRMLDIVGTRRGFILIMLWWSGACALHGLAMNFGFLLGARCLLGDGRGRSLSCCDQSCCGVDSAASAIDGDGNYQCGNSGWIGSGAAADRHHSADGWDGGWSSSRPGPWDSHG